MYTQLLTIIYDTYFSVNENHTNQRKRGREINSIFSSPSMHQQQQPHIQEPQLIDLTQLHTPSQNAVVSTGLRLSFGDHLQNQSVSLLTQDFATQVKHQRDEIDQFLQAQVLIHQPFACKN